MRVYKRTCVTGVLSGDLVAQTAEGRLTPYENIKLMTLYSITLNGYTHVTTWLYLSVREYIKSYDFSIDNVNSEITWTGNSSTLINTTCLCVCLQREIFVSPLKTRQFMHFWKFLAQRIHSDGNHNLIISVDGARFNNMWPSNLYEMGSWFNGFSIKGIFYF